MKKLFTLILVSLVFLSADLSAQCGLDFAADRFLRMEQNVEQNFVKFGCELLEFRNTMSDERGVEANDEGVFFVARTYYNDVFLDGSEANKAEYLRQIDEIIGELGVYTNGNIAGTINSGTATTQVFASYWLRSFEGLKEFLDVNAMNLPSFQRAEPSLVKTVAINGRGLYEALGG